MASEHPVYVVQHNHFDPIWRRCWQRSFDFRGKRYRPYADLEEYFINIWLENAKKGCTFSEGQAVVFRNYLERNPERLEEMQRLVADKVIELTAAGETVPDTNMPSGETLLRNLVMGQFWFERVFGIIPDVGWLEDAFGQSAQIPQIYRGCECRSLQKLSYKRVPGDYWKGLDGTVIYTADPPNHASAGGGIKIAPCPECAGEGCAVCAYPGLGDTSHVRDEEVENIFANLEPKAPFTLVHLGGEEAVPNPRLHELVERARREHGLDIRYGGYSVMNDYFAEQIAAADDPGLEVSDQVEANPVSTGCYVSRIEIKQRFREVENLIASAEKWATIGMLQGCEYPEEALTEAWQNLLFCAFHDAITSTHINAAYYELLEMLETAEMAAMEAVETACGHLESRMGTDHNSIVLYNSSSWDRQDPVTVAIPGAASCPALSDSQGKDLTILDAELSNGSLNVTFIPPAVAAMGYATVNLQEGPPQDRGEVVPGAGSIENEFFRITASDTGITEIVDKRTGRQLMDTSTYLANELLLEEDIGHPWGTMQIPSFEERLGQYTTSVKIRKGAHSSDVLLIGQYRGNDENVDLLTWTQKVTLYADVERISFRTDVTWDTRQRRIRVLFPTPIKTDEAIYSIPYGSLKRGAYEPDMRGYPSTNGDWPAINWVDVEAEDASWGVALVNSGTPSHAVKEGVIQMSLLRSPADSWCLNEPEFYDCPDFDEARDAGSHSFEYWLIPHEGNHGAAKIDRLASELNNPLLVRQPHEEGSGELALEGSFAEIQATDNVAITALKKAERDDTVVVRVAETAGRPGEVTLSVDGAGTKAELVNYLERHPQPLQWPLKLEPFKVLTVKLSK